MALSPASSHGASLSSHWTVATSGGLTIDTDGADGTLELTLGDVPGTNAELGVIDNGATTSARLTLQGQAGGSGTSLNVANGSAAGTAGVVNGEGTLSLFTKAGSKGIDAWDDVGNVLEFALLPAGQIMTGAVAAPDSGDLSASQLAFWFDTTNGAAKLMLKGKSADGTVVTGFVALI